MLENIHKFSFSLKNLYFQKHFFKTGICNESYNPLFLKRKCQAFNNEFV